MSNGTNKPILTQPIFHEIQSFLGSGVGKWLNDLRVETPQGGNVLQGTEASAIANINFNEYAQDHINWALSMLKSDAAVVGGIFDANDPRMRAFMFMGGGNPIVTLLLFNPNTNSALQEFVRQFAESFFGPGASNYPEVLLALSQWFAQMAQQGGSTVNVAGIPTAARTPIVTFGAGFISGTVPNLFAVLAQVAQMMALRSSGSSNFAISEGALNNIVGNVFGNLEGTSSFKEGVGNQMKLSDFIDAYTTGRGTIVPSAILVRPVQNGNPKIVSIKPGISREAIITGLKDGNEEASTVANLTLGAGYHVRWAGYAALAQAAIYVIYTRFYKEGTQASATVQTLLNVLFKSDGWVKKMISDNHLT